MKAALLYLLKVWLASALFSPLVYLIGQALVYRANAADAKWLPSYFIMLASYLATTVVSFLVAWPILIWLLSLKWRIPVAKLVVLFVLEVIPVWITLHGDWITEWGKVIFLCWLVAPPAIFIWVFKLRPPLISTTSTAENIDLN